MEEIYKKYSKQVYRFLYSLTRNHELSEELMQETFYSAIKGIKDFKGNCSMYSWLCEIAKNKLKNYKIKYNKIQTISLDNVIENWLTKDDIEENFYNNIDRIALHNEIEKLENITKDVVKLRIECELSFKQIGKILNRSEVWARITFYRAKAKLKEPLKNEKRM